MTERQRYVETVTFGNPDKVPLNPGLPRESTLKAWRRQGLPEDKDYMLAMYEELGLEPPAPPADYTDIGVDFTMIPRFEEEVLEHKDGHYIVRDWMGAITEISDEFDYTYLRNPKDFVTRKWHKFPVETREDWQEMKKRFRLDTPGRFPADLEERAERLKNRGYLCRVSVSAPFWQMREFCGFENLCTLFIEDPDFVHEMAEFWGDFAAGMFLKIASAGITPDAVFLSEDMAYKAHPMISPKMTREFLMPVYKKWAKVLKDGGTNIISMDSDGYIGDLIPIWIESGINVCEPIEVAAHCDINAFRKEFGNRMAYSGGIDKRIMAAGGKALVDEIKRIEPVVRGGGYIPSCDHGVPSDISWQNYLETARLLAKITGWM